MPIVMTKPFHRFELKYGKYFTVLEGTELDALFDAYSIYTIRLTENAQEHGISTEEPNWPMTVSMLSSINAYLTVYPDSVSMEELGNLSTPDARKMDLFYRGMAICMRYAFYPDENWNDLYKGWKGGLAYATKQYARCFISYSSKDEEFAQRLYSGLARRKVPCWFAPKDIPIGGKIWDEIRRAIDFTDKVIVILSKNSIQSEWVEDEITAAFENERNLGKEILIPVRIDDEVMTSKEAWASKVRARNIADFTNWNEEAVFRKGILRIVRSLSENRSI